MDKHRNAAQIGLALAGLGLLACAAMAAEGTPQQSSPSEPMSAWQILTLIGISGFFGGMVDGLRSERHYKWRFGSFAKEWGTLGDALVGVTAALAIFAFAENIFGSERFTTAVTVYSLLKLVAWGVLSGYAGTKLLDPLTSKAVKDIAKEEAVKAVKQQTVAGDEALHNLEEAAQKVTQHLQIISALKPGETNTRALGLLDEAQRKYTLVLQSDPGNLRAQLGLANVHSYRAEYQQRANLPDAKASFAKAIKTVDDLIRREPKLAKAYYNRACYKTLAAGPDVAPPEAVDDLLEAVELDENLKQYAADDPDLVKLRKHPKLTFLAPTTEAKKEPEAVPA